MPLHHDEFPALEHFLGAYLHQDWHDEYASTDEGFRDFLDGEPRYAALITAELVIVLESGLNETQLETLVLDCGSFYLPSRNGIPTSTWLAGLLDMCPASEGGTQ